MILQTLCQNSFGFRVCNKIGLTKCLSDEDYLKFMYKYRLNKELDLDKPCTFNEKMQWLKLHDRKTNYTNFVDKYEAKLFVERVIGKNCIIRTLGLWNKFEEIDFSKLPNKFVLKTTHDSGGVIICKDKTNFDFNNAKRILNNSLNKNYYYHGREWPYKNVVPRIIAEEYVVDESGTELKDYKVFTFNGEAFCIQVDYDRFTNHHRNFYDREWRYLPFTTCYPTDPKHTIDKPENLGDLIYTAEALSRACGKPAFLRVDMYVIGQRILFGELTFYHGSGMEIFYPDKWDKILGSKINMCRDQL